MASDQAVPTRGATFGTGLAMAALVTPLLVGTVLAAWALAQSPLESAAPVQPLIGVVEAAERHGRAPDSVDTQPYPVVSQSTGTVTAVSLLPGEPIAVGATPFAVDGLLVTAYVSPAPLFRDITSGVVGEDVATAQGLLTHLGYLKKSEEGAGPATVAAIASFNKDHGLGDRNESLAIGSLLWVPEGSAAPQTVTVRVGQLVAPQSELYVTTDTPPEPTEPERVGTVPASAILVGDDGGACFFRDATGSGVPIDASHGSFGMVDVDPELIGTPVLINPRVTRKDLSCGS